jgi:hypothetical protein
MDATRSFQIKIRSGSRRLRQLHLIYEGYLRL